MATRQRTSSTKGTIRTVGDVRTERIPRDDGRSGRRTNAVGFESSTWHGKGCDRRRWVSSVAERPGYRGKRTRAVSIRSNCADASWLDPRPSVDRIEQHVFDARNVSTESETHVHGARRRFLPWTCVRHLFHPPLPSLSFSDRPIHVIGSCPRPSQPLSHPLSPRGCHPAPSSPPVGSELDLPGASEAFGNVPTKHPRSERMLQRKGTIPRERLKDPLALSSTACGYLRG